jgi:hypothetical protein
VEDRAVAWKEAPLETGALIDVTRERDQVESEPSPVTTRPSRLELEVVGARARSRRCWRSPPR